MIDPIVEQVKSDLDRRSEVGIRKYGKTLERDDKSCSEWATEAYEEALDLCLYLKKLISKLEGDGI